MKKPIAMVSCNDTGNVGDWIQELGLRKILPRVDFTISRENFSVCETFPRETKIFVNGWYASGRHEHFPPQREAFYIGFHGDPQILPNNPRHPIGCRDLGTWQFCLDRKIPAWVSWCASLFLNEAGEGDSREIYLVDLPEDAQEGIPEWILESSRSLTHHLPPGTSSQEAMERAKEILARYRNAGLVITTRVHAMLPCLAMGTPVLFIGRGDRPWRWTCYEHLAYRQEDMPWAEVRKGTLFPKTSPLYIQGMMRTFRDMVDGYVSM